MNADCSNSSQGAKSCDDMSHDEGSDVFDEKKELGIGEYRLSEDDECEIFSARPLKGTK